MCAPLSIEIAKNFATSLLLSGLFVVHDAHGSGHDHKTKLTGGEQVGGPLLDVLVANIEPGRDDSTLVQTSVQLHNNLSGTVVIDNFKLTDVTVLLHHLEKLHNHLGGRSDENLATASLLSVVDIFQGISENTHAHHLDCKECTK